MRNQSLGRSMTDDIDEAIERWRGAAGEDESMPERMRRLRGGQEESTMTIHIQFIEHESQVSMALLDTSGEEYEQIDGASLGGYDLDADAVREAWEEAVLAKADYIRARRRGWASSPLSMDEFIDENQTADEL